MKKLVEQIKAQENIPVPYKVWTCFGEDSKFIFLAGNQASLGGDYHDLATLRKAIEFYVDQLGGSAEWKD